MGKLSPYADRARALIRITDALSSFMDKRGGREHAHLTRLWEHWSMVMGEELSSLAIPLGHRKEALVLGAEDSMAAQEIAMQSFEVLERANAFMNQPYFSRIQVELVMGRLNLSQPQMDQHPHPPAYRVPKPEKLGTLQGTLDPESPVTRCYEAYLRYFSRAL